MSMVYCRGCAKEIHESAPICPHCGCVQIQNTGATISPPIPAASIATHGADTKFHITLIVSAFVAVLLLYATRTIPLIGAATGVCFGLSVRLFMTHKKNGFAGTNKWDWVAIALFSAAALILFMTQDYQVQAPLLLYVAIRSLILYFKIYSSSETSIPTTKKN